MAGRLVGKTTAALCHGRLAHVTFVASLLVAALAAPALAQAATISGSLIGAHGSHLVLVQADGTAKQARITPATGAFRVSGVLNAASLQIVQSNGAYYGPVVLKAYPRRTYIFMRGNTNLKLGRIERKRGYALVMRMAAARYQTALPYTAIARRDVPVGVGRLGLVATPECLGYNGPGGDLDRDGIITAFDVDANGNLTFNNIDRSGRGSGQPWPPRTHHLASPAVLKDAPSDPAPAPQPPGFHVFSNFKLRDATSINADIPGISDIDALIASYLPGTLTLATQVVGGQSATLDGLGNGYLAPHTISDGRTYPLVNGASPTYTGSLLNLLTGPTHDCQLGPGAAPDQIGSGDSFLETTPDGQSCVGSLNFVFDTAPALVSYQFDSQASPTVVSYDAGGVAANGLTPSSPIVVPSGATSLTLTIWRPQRRAIAGEVGNADGWIDIGGLEYRADFPDPACPPTGPLDGGTHNASGAYSDASANGVAVATGPTSDGVFDSAQDAPADPANTVSFTLSLPTCFSDWALFASGTTFNFDIEAQSLYGDNAARGLFFVLQ